MLHLKEKKQGFGKLGTLFAFLHWLSDKSLKKNLANLNWNVGNNAGNLFCDCFIIRKTEYLITKKTNKPPKSRQSLLSLSATITLTPRCQDKETFLSLEQTGYRLLNESMERLKALKSRWWKYRALLKHNCSFFGGVPPFFMTLHCSITSSHLNICYLSFFCSNLTLYS